LAEKYQYETPRENWDIPEYREELRDLGFTDEEVKSVMDSLDTASDGTDGYGVDFP
jgi:hypothetical protein